MIISCSSIQVDVWFVIKVKSLKLCMCPLDRCVLTPDPRWIWDDDQQVKWDVTWHTHLVHQLVMWADPLALTVRNNSSTPHVFLNALEMSLWVFTALRSNSCFWRDYWRQICSFTPTTGTKWQALVNTLIAPHTVNQVSHNTFTVAEKGSLE